MRITHADLLQIIHYDPLTGVFKRLDTGKVTNCIGKRGYVEIRIKNVLYYGHRLAWFYMTGIWPTRVDHENNQRHANHWTNLRLATRTQNNRNSVLRKNNRSGFKGVSFHPAVDKWVATITVDKKQMVLGYFAEPIDAAQAYDAAATLHHGSFAKTNKTLGLLT